MSWAGRGAKQPMMQGTVPPELRSSAYAANDILFFAGFYWSYPRDAARLRAQMAQRGKELGQ